MLLLMLSVMKRALMILLSLALSLSLAGCGEKAGGPEPGTPVASFYEAILAAQPEEAEELILFEESDPALIGSFYAGLDGIELNQKAFYMPPIATHPCEIVLVEVKNGADV